MQIQGTGHIHGPQAVNAPHRATATGPTAPTHQAIERGVDQLDISPEADMVSRARELPDIRHDLVASIREQIAAGVYETDEKINVAVENLLDEIA